MVTNSITQECKHAVRNITLAASRHRSYSHFKSRKSVVVKRMPLDRVHKKNRKIRERKMDEITHRDAFLSMMGDEKLFPVMRIYNEDTKHLDEVVQVYKFYFDDIYTQLRQQARTMHLAMAYFTQTIMRCPCLQK